MNSTPPLALYIHIPWCEKKCPYCDFNSHQAKGTVDEAAYVQCLLDDLDQDIQDFGLNAQNREVSTIFIGGGTPSLFSTQSMATILDGVKSRIACAEHMEVTCEANPGSSEAEKFAGFRAAGINRLSIGVQSFNQAHLKALGRVHNSSEALAAAEFAKQAGFDNFNLDLMFGLPNQTLAQAAEDLQYAIDLAPTHLSCYQLTIEPNTLFHHQPPVTPDHESLWELQLALQNKLAEHHYQQYEVSAYALGENRCRHNLNYWQFGDYLGIGAGAHGKITNRNGAVSRRWKVKHPNSYLRGTKNYLGGTEIVDPSQLPFEFMMNALRLSDGIDLAVFEERCGLPRTVLDSQLNQHLTLGLISLDQGHLKPSERGRQLLDSMLQDYLPD